MSLGDEPGYGDGSARRRRRIRRHRPDPHPPPRRRAGDVYGGARRARSLLTQPGHGRRRRRPPDRRDRLREPRRRRLAASTGARGGDKAETAPTAASGEQPVETKTGGIPRGSRTTSRGRRVAAANYAVALGSAGMFNTARRHAIVDSRLRTAEVAELQDRAWTRRTPASFLTRRRPRRERQRPAGQHLRLPHHAGRHQGHRVLRRHRATVEVWCTGLFGTGRRRTPPTRSPATWFTMTSNCSWTDGDWKVDSFAQKDGPAPVTGDDRPPPPTRSARPSRSTEGSRMPGSTAPRTQAHRRASQPYRPPLSCWPPMPSPRPRRRPRRRERRPCDLHRRPRQGLLRDDGGGPAAPAPPHRPHRHPRPPLLPRQGLRRRRLLDRRQALRRRQGHRERRLHQPQVPPAVRRRLRRVDDPHPPAVAARRRQAGRARRPPHHGPLRGRRLPLADRPRLRLHPADPLHRRLGDRRRHRGPRRRPPATRRTPSSAPSPAPWPRARTSAAARSC